MMINRFLDNQAYLMNTAGDGDGGGGGASAGNSGGSGGGGDGSGGIDNGGQPWYNGLSEDLRGDPNITRYKTQEEAMRGLVHLNKFIGQQDTNKILVPGQDASDQDWADFYSKTGRPDEASAYGLDYDPGDKKDFYNPDDEFKAQFADKAHEMGLNKRQAGEFWRWFNDGVVAVNEGIAKEIGQRKAQAEETLKRDWGNDYDRNIAATNQMLNKFGTEEEVAYLRERIGNDPKAANLLSKIANGFSEDTLETGDFDARFGMSTDAARREYNDITSDPSHAYWNRDAVGHKDAVERVGYLSKIIHGDKVVAVVGTRARQQSATG